MLLAAASSIHRFAKATHSKGSRNRQAELRRNRKTATKGIGRGMSASRPGQKDPYLRAAAPRLRADVLPADTAHDRRPFLRLSFDKGAKVLR
jgi:hypothetical protein